MEISENRLTLREGDSAQGRILCTADAHPEADFTWVRMEEGGEDSTGGGDGEDEDSTSVADGNVLFFDGGGVTRDQVRNSTIFGMRVVNLILFALFQGGMYLCVASNRHGNATAETFVDVQCELQ